MLLHGGSSKGSELQGLGSPEEIALFVQQQDALVVQAKREEAQEHVRHLKFDRVQRIVLLALGVLTVVVMLIGAISNPELLNGAAGAGGVGGVLAAVLYRWGVRAPGHRN